MLASEGEGGDGRIKSEETRFYYACFGEGEVGLADKKGEIAILLCLPQRRRQETADKNEENAILLCSSKQKMGEKGG